jgi:FixJ family two-component response regulator
VSLVRTGGFDGPFLLSIKLKGISLVTANFRTINRSDNTSPSSAGADQTCNPAWPLTDVICRSSPLKDSDGSSQHEERAVVSVFASPASLAQIVSLLPDQRIHVCNDWHHAMDAFLTGQGGCIMLEIDNERRQALDLLRQANCDWDLLSVIAFARHDSGDLAMTAARAGCQDFISLSGLNQNALESQLKIQHACRLDMDGEYSRQQFRANWKTLTARERDVLRRSINGDNSKSLAKQLTVTYQTIDKHRNRALRKMNCNSLIEFSNLLYQLRSIASYSRLQ